MLPSWCFLKLTIQQAKKNQKKSLNFSKSIVGFKHLKLHYWKWFFTWCRWLQLSARVKPGLPVIQWKWGEHSVVGQDVFSKSITPCMLCNMSSTPYLGTRMRKCLADGAKNRKKIKRNWKKKKKMWLLPKKCSFNMRQKSKFFYQNEK